MAFGQQSGPPASARDVEELLGLLRAAGHADFRDARGPMGFTQRQAGGRFTRDEVAAFIAQLESGESGGAGTASPPTWRQSTQKQVLGALPSEQLAEELRQRGYMVIEPLEPLEP